MTIRFDDAWENAIRTAYEISDSKFDIILVRDILGRISAIADGPLPKGLRSELIEGLGRFASPSPIVDSTDLFSPDSILSASDLHVLRERDASGGRIAFLERSVVGADWYRPPFESDGCRVAMYGFKGGVGRSTATAMLAKSLANKGRCVLVVDLDLESPGVGGLLGQGIEISEHGIVDHLVEAAVDNADGLDLVTAVSPSGETGNGEVWLASAEGRSDGYRNYAAKLNRVYSDLPRGMRFGERIQAAVSCAENQVAERSRNPDVVLLDSRAGLHDVAGVAITQLADLSLLFATNNLHTWHGYGTLFRQWRDNLPRESLNRIRGRIKMIAAMVPTDAPDQYLSRFRDSAQTCFADYLYDESGGALDVDAFNFFPEDSDAPHSPIPILFSTDLVGLDSRFNSNWHAMPLVTAAYDQFLHETESLILGSEI